VRRRKGIAVSIRQQKKKTVLVKKKQKKEWSDPGSQKFSRMIKPSQEQGVGEELGKGVDASISTREGTGR